MTFEIFLNILIVALLTIGIVYAIVLEHRLSSAKENRRELALLIDQFYKASQKTSEELVGLKNMEAEARAALKTDLDRAALVRDELNFLLNKIKKNVADLGMPEPMMISAEEQETPKSLSNAEQELINALNALK